jgi:hypothetical protein
MASIKTIVDGLSRQIDQAIEGKANVEQADILCKSVDTLIKLAKLQIEMASINWNGSDERPVIEMEKQYIGDGERPAKALTATALTAPVKKTDENHTQVKTPSLNQNVQNAEKLNRPESDQNQIGFDAALKSLIHGSKENIVSVDYLNAGIVARFEHLEDDIRKIPQTLIYWASKGHLEKVGTGAFARFRITDRDFFNPAK